MVVLHEGEAVDFLPRYRGEAALVYTDTLFNTGDTFETKDGTCARKGEVAFVDRFASEGEFRAYLEAVMEASYGALADHGALVLHCDYRFQPLVRQIGDRLFQGGAGGFADEIVWAYRRWSTVSRRCNRVHDYLIRYVRDFRQARWTQLYQPLAESTRATWGTKKQKAVVGADGQRVRSTATQEESPGVPLGDVWTDIGLIAPSSKERTGYPTQKPEALLERVVTITSAPGDLVIDPTMGSATTLAVARRLGRRVVGIDRSPVAIRVARARLGLDPVGEAA